MTFLALAAIAVAAFLGVLFGLETGLVMTGFVVAAFLGYLFGLGTGYQRGRLDEQRALLAELERRKRAA